MNTDKAPSQEKKRPRSLEENRRSKRQRNLASGLLLAIVLVGAALRLIQYFADPALYIDEIAVASNVLERNVWELLTTPLAYDQTAPKGFLLAVKLATSAFGSSDYALRLFPLICSLIALVGFWRVAERVCNGVGAPVALALFATAIPFLFYAAQVKQYSADIAVSVLLLWLALYLAQHDSTRPRALWAGAAGAVAVWFSQPSVFVLTGLGAGLILIKRFAPVEGSRSFSWHRLVPVLTLWGVAIVAATLAGLASMTSATHDYMERVWVNGLLPLPVTRAVSLLWPWPQLQRLFGDGTAAGLGYPAPELYIALTGLGFWLLWRRRRNVALLLVTPLAVTLAAAVLRQYPFTDRLILFLIPSFILAMAVSVDWIWRLVASYSRVLAALALVIIVTPAIDATIATPPVYQMENIKPVLAHLQAKRLPTDAVYVFYGAGPAVTFYDAKYGLSETEYVLGGCHRGDSRRYLEELDMFRGYKRFWVVITHALSMYREREDILRYLDTIGARHESLIVPAQTVDNLGWPAEVFLYDLSDPERLGNALANSFELTGPSSVNPRFACDYGPQAMISRLAPNSSPMRR
ncbi:MAG: glycosyltransferase family 39 protein [Candidatus Binatia bacterium]